MLLNGPLLCLPPFSLTVRPRDCSIDDLHYCILTGSPRVPLAFASMTPKEVCYAFSKGLRRPVRYKRGPIQINVPTPIGYREHLSALEYTLGERGAPYFGPDLEPSVPKAALELWEGNRSMEEYAKEVFPVEEAANGLTWMAEIETPQKALDVEFEQINC